jgi:hypothetical protein
MLSFITSVYCGTTQDEQVSVQRIMVFKLCIMIVVFTYTEDAEKMYTHFKRCYLCTTFLSWIE